jgi:hypothetical protein
VGPSGTVGRQIGEEDVKTSTEDLGIIAKPDSRGIGSDRAEVAKRCGNCPGKTVAGLRVSKGSVIRDDHHVALERAVVVDVEITLICGFWIEVAGASSEGGLQVPSLLIVTME